MFSIFKRGQTTDTSTKSEEETPQVYGRPASGRKLRKGEDASKELSDIVIVRDGKRPNGKGWSQ